MSTATTRRGFLKGAMGLVAGAAAVAAGVKVAEAAVPETPVPAEKPTEPCHSMLGNVMITNGTNWHVSWITTTTSPVYLSAPITYIEY